MTLTNDLSAAGVTYLVYLRQAQSNARLDTVFQLAQAIAQNSPTFGALLVNVNDLSVQEAALVGSTSDVDAVLLSRGDGLARTRLASYHLDAVDDPLEMIVAWGLDR